VRYRDGKEEIRTINQLEYVVSLWKKRAEKGGRPRQSALQLACFDPAKDDTGSPLAGFPCLQQISLTYHEEGTLEINGYYPTQYMFDRAYGNYLGLCQLGHLIAHEVGARFTAMTCFIARPQLGSGSKASHAELAHVLQDRINQLAPAVHPEDRNPIST
jgi:thymidylate synthase